MFGDALSVQMILVLVAVAASVLYFGRGFVAGLLGRGCGTEGGCAKCSSGGGCTVTKMDALRKEYEARKSGESLS